MAGAQIAGTPSFSTFNYALPTTNVRYVSPSGNDSNPGTLESPMLSTAAAAQQIKASGTAQNPATVVLRAGSHVLNQYAPGNNTTLRFQAYPGEEVWFDGSTVVAGSWTSNGNGSWTADYAAPAVPPQSYYVFNGDTNGLLPDMCLVDGVQLYQTADNTTPSAGQFSVNRGANKVTIATDPAGKELRMATVDSALFSGSRIDLLGVGFRRYRCGVAAFMVTMIYFSGTEDGHIIENCRFEDIGRTVLSLNRKNMRVTACTFENIGEVPIGGHQADNIVIENCKFLNSNSRKFKAQPVVGVIKLTAARGTVIRHNWLKYMHGGMGIWYDDSMSELQCYGNEVYGASKDGTTYSEGALTYEGSEGGFWEGVQRYSYIVGNTLIDGNQGLSCMVSGWAVMANNTIRSYKMGIRINQDRDDNRGVYVPIANLHWWCTNYRLLNNRIMPQQGGGWQLLLYDSQQWIPRLYAIAAGLGDDRGCIRGGDMVEQVESNWFSPATGNPSAGMGSVMALVADLFDNRSFFNTPATLRINNPTLGLTTTKIQTNYQSAGEPTGADHDTAVPTEAPWSAMVGLPVGTPPHRQPTPTPDRPPVRRKHNGITYMAARHIPHRHEHQRQQHQGRRPHQRGGGGRIRNSNHVGQRVRPSGRLVGKVRQHRRSGRLLDFRCHHSAHNWRRPVLPLHDSPAQLQLGVAR